MNAIAVVGLAAGYDGVDVLHDVDLHVAPGELVALLGVNGAGKTTTVRTICGLVTARHGSVLLGDVDVTTEPTHRRARRGLAVVVDDRQVFATMTAAENLRLGSKRGDGARFIEDWLPEIGFLLDRGAGLLSGGEQQIVAVARALVGRPKALIVDELSAGLAPDRATSVISALRRATQEWGTGVLIAEQATQLALGAADRAVVLANGRVAFEGRAAEVANRPDVLEATYLGQRKPFQQ